ncbi:MAG: hypothetical protein HC767_10295 [Akkermansiaceae bacterium]|nr:hypothetical protein [Akkermansiaceae bacterium]
MSFPIRIAFISAIVAASSLVSCTTVSKVGKGSMAIAQSATKATTSGVAKLSTAVTDKISPSGVKVVEVREKDLKVMPTGKEKLLALEAKQDRMAARAAFRKIAALGSSMVLWISLSQHYHQSKVKWMAACYRQSIKFSLMDRFAACCSGDDQNDTPMSRLFCSRLSPFR